MKISYENYEIEIREESNYTFNSTDNLRQFEKVYFEGKNHEDRFYPNNKYSVIVYQDAEEISSAVICEIGGKTSITGKTFVIDGDKIWICIGDKVYCLTIPKLELVWCKKLDYVTVFSINKLENDFIIHGELEIKRITKSGEIVWYFSGRDIWINMEGKTELQIENDRIKLFDFESNEYNINFNGKLIEDQPKIIQKKWWKIFG